MPTRTSRLSLLSSPSAPLVLAAICAAGLAAPPAQANATRAPVTIEVEGAVIDAARALGPDVLFFTSRARPLAALAELREPAIETGTGDLALARPLWALLRAGGVKYGGGALELMKLGSDHHFATVFAANRRLRLFAVRARADGRERVIEEKGGGLRVVLRERGGAARLVGSAVSAPSKPVAATQPFVTSFGPLVRAELTASVRTRQFDPQDGARKDRRQARKGQTFLVLHVDRDFSSGLGTISYLFGSGILVQPEFERLAIADARGRRYPLAATYADGRTLELAYQVPAAAAGFTLEDGDQRLPLAPLLAPRTASGTSP